MSDEVLIEKRDDGIAVLTLNRPQAMNSINSGMVAAMRRAVADVEADPSVHVIVLTAAGERAFCTGIDLKERQTLTQAQADHLRNREMFPMYRELDGTAKPKIAAVFGHTLAGGFEFALCADLIVAAQGTSFGLPEVKWGLIPAAGGCRKLPALMGPARAKEIILTASTFDAQTALECGVVNRVVPRERLMETALTLATAILANMQHAVRGAKRAIDDGIRAEAACRYDMEVAEVCYAQRNLDAFGKN